MHSFTAFDSVESAVSLQYWQEIFVLVKVKIKHRQASLQVIETAAVTPVSEPHIKAATHQTMPLVACCRPDD